MRLIVNNSGAGMDVLKRAPVLLGVAGAVGFETSVAAWGVVALEGRGLDIEDATLGLSLYFAVFLGARLVAVAAGAIVQARSVLTTTLLVAAACCLAASVAPAPTTWFAAAGVVGASFPAAFLWATARLERRRRVAPLVIVAALCGGIGGPVLVGYLVRAFGNALLLPVLGAVGAAALVPIVAVRACRHPDGPARTSSG